MFHYEIESEQSAMDISAIMFLIEIIGTISFAISGSLVAIERDCDLFGVIVLGVTTAIGGGMVRDLVLDVHPLNAFRHPIYASVAAIVCFVVFFTMYFHDINFQSHKHAWELADLWSDSLGLGIFVVVGINTALSTQANSAFLTLFVGIITGVGGGMLRDIMAIRMPMILQKRIYAVAALLGGMVYYYSLFSFPNSLSVCTGISTTVLIRLLAAHYRWDLPRVSDRFKKNNS